MADRPTSSTSTVRSLAPVAVVMVAPVAAFAFTGGSLLPARLTPAKIVNVLARLGAPAPGHRRSYAKGICFTSSFESNGAAAALSKAPMFAAASLPVAGRFNPGTRDPNGPDAMKNFVAAHPAFGAFGAWPVGGTWTESYARKRHNSFNSFIFTDAAGQDQAVRWSFEPAVQPKAVSPDRRCCGTSNRFASFDDMGPIKDTGCQSIRGVPLKLELEVHAEAIVARERLRMPVRRLKTVAANPGTLARPSSEQVDSTICTPLRLIYGPRSAVRVPAPDRGPSEWLRW